MTLALITQTNYNNILSTYLGVMDVDPSYDVVEQLLADIIAARNGAQWLIGDLLVFLRQRTDYQTVKVFNWTGSFSKELIDFIQREYNAGLTDLERGDFLCWTVYKHEKFWLLSDEDEIRVWEYNPTNISDDEFDGYLDNLTIRLKAALGDSSLRAYYRTSRVYPFSLRTPHSWTYHYEKTNYIASKVGANTRGEERLQLIADHVEETTEEFERNGVERVAQVRDKIQDHNQNERGYKFKVPLPKTLIIVNTETGETFNGLEFTGKNPNAINAILAASGIYIYHKGVELTWRDSEAALYDGKGDLVATCPYIDEIVVAEAVSYLSERMGWDIDMELK